MAAVVAHRGYLAESLRQHHAARTQILETPYSIKALRGDRTVAQAVLNAFGWHVPTAPAVRSVWLYVGPLRLRRLVQTCLTSWVSVDTRDEARALVTRLAIGGA